MGFGFKPPENTGYQFEKPAVKALADKMIRVSQGRPNWDKLVKLMVKAKRLVDAYGARDRDLHRGIFQNLDRVKNDDWLSAFNFLVHIIIHPETASGTLNELAESPGSFPWLRKFLSLKDAAKAVEELKQKLGI
ncbi:MAG: hypothetical protein AB1721_00175 [Patescibacteria group bacterium]